MCFRPSAVASTNNGNIQESTCPSCGMPVAAAVGTTSGTCPHCNQPIPSSVEGAGKDVAMEDKRIL